MGEPLIRRARAVDAGAVAGLVEAMGGHDEVTARPGWPRAFAEVLAHPFARALVAEERDGRLVGYAEVQARPSVLHGRREAWLAALAVAPDRRGEGVGRALVEAATRAAAALGCSVVVVETSHWRDDAAATYLALGFEEVAAPARRFARLVGPPPRHRPARRSRSPRR